MPTFHAQSAALRDAGAAGRCWLAWRGGHGRPSKTVACRFDSRGDGGPALTMPPTWRSCAKLAGSGAGWTVDRHRAEPAWLGSVGASLRLWRPYCAGSCAPSRAAVDVIGQEEVLFLPPSQLVRPAFRADVEARSSPLAGFFKLLIMEAEKKVYREFWKVVKRVAGLEAGLCSTVPCRFQADALRQSRRGLEGAVRPYGRLRTKTACSATMFQTHQGAEKAILSPCPLSATAVSTRASSSCTA